MDIALVTGADAGPGLAIARRLLGMGCRVYALATQFARNPYPHDDFIPVSVNLADPAALTQAVEELLAKEGHVSFVVHAARRPPAPLLDSSVADLAERVQVGLLAPLVLARAALPWLRKEKGHFIVLCWSGEGVASGGPVTAAIEGGLQRFTEQLFDELRDDGVRATTVHARPNAETPAEAALALDPQSAINPELLADAVEQLLRLRPSNVVTALVVRPAATAETPRLPRSTELAGLATRDVQLPPRQNFPREAELIPTPPRARPDDAPPPGTEDAEEEFDEDEEDDWDPRREPLPWANKPEPDRPEEAAAREGPPRASPPREGPPREGPPREGPPREPGPGRGPERRREDDFQGQGRGGRRGGRGRGRGRGRDGGPPEPFRERDARPQRPAADYPDPEQEAAERALARDDSFRTPHLDSDSDEGEAAIENAEVSPNPETDFEAIPRVDDGFDPGSDSPGPPPAEREPAPPVGARPAPARPAQAPAHRGPPQHGPQHHSQQRRHRGYGRRPPPNAGRRGPDAD